MLRLPDDVFAYMTKWMSLADYAMLSIVNKKAVKKCQRKNRLLDLSIISNDDDRIRLCEEWGNEYTDITFYWLGTTGNRVLVESKIYSLSFFGYNILKVSKESIDCIYQGACYEGNLDILKWLDETFPSLKDFRYTFVRPASLGHQYEVLDYLATKKNSHIQDVFCVACKEFDIELIKYCTERDIKFRFDIDMLFTGDKTPEYLIQVRKFLEQCREIGISFDNIHMSTHIKTFSWILMFVSFGFRRYSNHKIFPFVRKNLGMIDWNDENQKKFFLLLVNHIILFGTYLEGISMKNFMKCELDCNSTMTQKIYYKFHKRKKNVKKYLQEK